MRRYAANTKVSTERSRAEIERVLRGYGASDFVSGWNRNVVVLGFRANHRTIRFTMSMPDPTDKRFTKTAARGSSRSAEAAHKAWELECRRSWRALGLAIKAKLEAVQTGIATFEDEFLAYTVLPGGNTVADEIRPTVQAALDSGRMDVPLLLLTGGK